MRETECTIKDSCPRPEIVAYLDCELSAEDEFELDLHLANCEKCDLELSRQRRLLCALDFALDDEKHFELPKDFAKTIVVRAESNVKGLREKNEFKPAFLLCGTLFLLIALSLSDGFQTVFSMFANFSGQVVELAELTWHTLGDFGNGTDMILRTVANEFVFKSDFLTVVLILVLISSFFVLSRLLIRYHRA